MADLFERKILSEWFIPAPSPPHTLSSLNMKSNLGLLLLKINIKILLSLEQYNPIIILLDKSDNFVFAIASRDTINLAGKCQPGPRQIECRELEYSSQ